MTCVPGAVSIYKFEGNANDSVGSNNGTFNTPLYNTGHIAAGQAAEFFNAGYIDTNHVFDNDFTNGGDFTVAFWIRNSNAGPSTNNGRIVSAWGSGTDSILIFKESFQNVAFYAYDGTGTLRTTGTATVALDAYSYVTCVGDAQNNILRLYIDAVEKDTAALTNGIRTGTNDWFIGAQDETGALRLYDNRIDQLEIYNVVLSPAQITSQYNAGVGRDCPLVNQAPTGTPNPLNKTLGEGVPWTTQNQITFDDINIEQITITKNAGTQPAWVTEDIGLGIPATFPHVEPSGNVVLTLGGTPPFSGPGSAGSYSWSYDIDDGTAPLVNVPVNLTVGNVAATPKTGIYRSGIRSVMGSIVRK